MKEDLVYRRVPYLQYIIEEVWALVKQPIDCQHSRHLDLFSKHKEINFDNLSQFHYQLIHYLNW
jgi:hypothetical protein